MQQLFDTIPQAIREIDKDGRLAEAFAIGAWKNCVGSELAARSRPFKLEEHRLHVAVADEVWARHLESLAPTILVKLNAKLGQNSVRYLEFHIEPRQ